LTAADIAGLVAALDGEGKARESIRKSVTAFAMVLDFHGITPNPARDWIQVKLPREDPNEVEPPSAATVEAIGWLLTPAYLLGLLVLDAPACEWGSSRPRVSRTSTRAGRRGLSALPSRRHGGARWVQLPDDLFEAVIARLPAREDRTPDTPLFASATADRLRVAIGRACRDAAVPHFSPHDLRHRRISLMHRQGGSWAEIGYGHA
jgi:hypothetical protein